MTTRNPFTPRNAYGKPMRLGKQQIYVLTALFDDDGNMRKGIARSAWLHKVCDSLVKHGLAGKGVEKMYDGDTRIMGVWEPRYELTVLGQSERERLRPLRRQNVPLPADLIPSNKTLRQSAHIESGMRSQQLREASTTVQTEGRMLYLRSNTKLPDDVEEAAHDFVADGFMPALVEGRDLDTRIAIRRWLVALFIASYYTAKAEAAAKEVR